MNKLNIKNIFVFIFIFSILFSPQISSAQNKENSKEGNVSGEKATNSIISKLPDSLYKPLEKGINIVEDERKNLSIYAEKEILKTKSFKPTEKEGDSDYIFTNNSLTDKDQVFNQVKYYLFFILGFIAGQQLLFWGIFFFLVFAIIRTILRIIF